MVSRAEGICTRTCTLQESKLSLCRVSLVLWTVMLSWFLNTCTQESYSLRPLPRQIRRTLFYSVISRSCEEFLWHRCCEGSSHRDGHPKTVLALVTAGNLLLAS